MLRRVTTAERYAFGRVDLGALGERALLAQERVLDDVLGLAHPADHAVGEREQHRPQLLERLRAARSGAAGVSRVHRPLLPSPTVPKRETRRRAEL